MSIFLFPYFCEVNSFVIKRIIILNYQEHEKTNKRTTCYLGL